MWLSNVTQRISCAYITRGTTAMKKRVWTFLFFSFACNATQSTIEDIPCSCGLITITPSQAYAICKEYIYTFCIFPWWLNFTFAKSTKAVCNHCSYAITSIELHAYLLCYKEIKSITLLKQYLWNQEPSDLEDFMVYILNKLSVPCPACSVYNGWHTLSSCSIETHSV